MSCVPALLNRNHLVVVRLRKYWSALILGFVCSVGDDVFFSGLGTCGECQ